MELLLDILKWSVIVGTAALVLALLKPLLDRRYSAKWRYGVWLAMAAFLLLAPVRWEALLPEQAAAVTPPVVIEVPKVEVSVSQQEGVTFQRPAAVLAAPRPSGAAAKKAAVFPLEKVLAGLWLAGMGLFSAYHLLGTWYFTRKARRWSRQAGEDILQAYEAVRREMGLKKAPPLRVSGAVDSPMVIGLFRPCLLLPGEEFGARELAFILRHELTHYRRRDLWYKLALLAANGMHWFNPLAYLLRREAERDLELTCDDAVVAGRDAGERRAYSEALLASIHRQKGLSRAVLSTHFYGGKEVMMERFRNILGRQSRKWGGFVLVLALLVTVAAACAVGVKPSEDGALSGSELAEWQEKIESPEMDHYIYRMYTDVSYLPSDEKLDEIFPTPESVDVLGHADIDPRVLSGTKNGDTVTLEIEGNFGSRLPTGTLTLVNGEPVSFTNPLYTAVETAAREQMERAADDYISGAKEYASKELAFTEKYITSLFCSESMTIDGRTYYVWEFYYGMKPNDIGNVFFAGGMGESNGWVTQSSSAGDPILIASMDGDGNVAIEGQTWSGSIGEEGYTWEEYVYCHLYLGMDEMYGILNGWPEVTTEFLLSFQGGYDRWAGDWQDTALRYLTSVYGIQPEGDFTKLRSFFYENADPHSHSTSLVVQTPCGGRTVSLFLVSCPYEVYSHQYITFWQVCGVKWEPDAPDAAPEPGEPGTPDAAPAGELSEEELAAIAEYFNDRQHNGLLRVPYGETGTFQDLVPYLSIILYDMGESVSDEAELEALAEAFYDGDLPDTDCMKLKAKDIRDFFTSNFIMSTTGTWEVNAALESLKQQMAYLEEYDAFYMVHGDTMMANYTFDSGVRFEGGWLVMLYYTTDLWQYSDEGELDILLEQPMCAVLWRVGNGWFVVSNTIESAE